jgi:hypothetical protein
MAGVDVRTVVPREHVLDSRSPEEFYDLSAKPLDPLNPLGLDNKNADLQIIMASMGANCVN